MANRFGRLRQSERLSEAYTNYKTWQDRPYNPQPGTRGRMKSRMPVYLHPFGIEFQTNEVYSSKADPETFEELTGYLAGTGGGVANTLQSTQKVIKSPGFRASRIVIFRNETYQASSKRSDITLQDYLKYTGTRLTLPFGQASGPDELNTVFSKVRAKIFTTIGNNFETLRVTLQPEVFKG